MTHTFVHSFYHYHKCKQDRAHCWQLTKNEENTKLIPDHTPIKWSSVGLKNSRFIQILVDN